MAFPASSPAALDLVPPEHLEPPPGDELRYLVRDECALLLDGYLRRLARQEALGRDVLGSLARAFLGQRGQHALGFARVRDYARERLGLSARELQSLAHVSARLAELPEVAAAFAHGELSWTQVRLLVGVATAESAAAWVEVARGRTVRALEATIAHDTGRPVERDDTLDEEPRVQVRLRCPRRVRERWHAVTVLARVVAGEELAPWQVADAVAAEGFSARDLEPENPMVGLPGPECDPPPLERIDPGETPAVFGCLDWSALDEVLPADLERLRDGAADVNAFALDGRMRALLRATQRIDWQMGRLLRTFFALRLHRLMGFPSAAVYVRAAGALAAQGEGAGRARAEDVGGAGAPGPLSRGGALVAAGAGDRPGRARGDRRGLDRAGAGGHGAPARGRGGVGGRATGRGRVRCGE